MAGEGDASRGDELETAEPLVLDPDWRSYESWPQGTRKQRLWTSTAPGAESFAIPVYELALVDGKVGCAVWKGAAALADFLVQRAGDLLRAPAGREGGLEVLEVGCGCGLPGAAAACLARPPPRRLASADMWLQLLEVAQATAEAALRKCGVPDGAVQLEGLPLDWCEPPSSWSGAPHSFDVVLASDANDEDQCRPMALAKIFDHYARKQGSVVIDSNPETRGRLAEFRGVMVGEYGFTLEETLSRRVYDEPRVPGLTCGAEAVLIDVYRR